jgi:anti-sigma regulatory factor (Ser/Thr protein kinase)
MAAVLDLILPATEQAPGRAREAFDELPLELSPGRRDDLRLLVSELVTNSVRHGAGGPGAHVGVRALTVDDALRVEVRDAGPGFRPRSIGSSADRSGYGLWLVEQLAERWGIQRDGYTHVWFELDRRD